MSETQLRLKAQISRLNAQAYRLQAQVFRLDGYGKSAETYEGFARSADADAKVYEGFAGERGMSAPKVDVLGKLRSSFEGCENGNYSNGIFLHPADARRIHYAVAELIEASLAYFSDYCQDEADDDGVEFTGCSVEQHKAAKRLQAALASIGGDV